jgi:anti-anti-sigma factor
MYDPMDDVQVESPTPGTVVVNFMGEHDLVARQELRELLDSLVEENEVVVANFSHAQFVDSSTIHALVDADALARVWGKTFRLQLGTAAIVRRAFEVSGILERIECIHEDAELPSVASTLHAA